MLKYFFIEYFQLAYLHSFFVFIALGFSRSYPRHALDFEFGAGSLPATPSGRIRVDQCQCHGWPKRDRYPRLEFVARPLRLHAALNRTWAGSNGAAFSLLRPSIGSRATVLRRTPQRTSEFLAVVGEGYRFRRLPQVQLLRSAPPLATRAG
jgi:hypothetical protein